MNIDLEKALDASKEIIYGMYFFRGFKEYASTYFVTSECIKDYLEATDFLKRRALTILSGGDQVFNLITSDVNDIDAFDSNKLTYFVYHLRRAMINIFSYQDFKKANLVYTSSANNFSNHLDILNKVRNLLPEEVYEYFRKMIDFSTNNPMVNFETLFYKVSDNDFTRNNYLVSEEAYKKLQRKINDAKVNIIFEDGLLLPEELTSTYDIILLSNIADYFSKSNPDFGLKEFKEFIKSYINLLNPDGVLINYLYSVNDQNPIRNLPITREDLGLDKIQSVSNPVFKKSGEGYYIERNKVKQLVITK